MKRQILELLKMMLTLIVYAIFLFKSAKSDCFNAFDSVVVLIDIILSITLMFYLWGEKNEI